MEQGKFHHHRITSTTDCLRTNQAEENKQINEDGWGEDGRGWEEMARDGKRKDGEVTDH